MDLLAVGGMGYPTKYAACFKDCIAPVGVIELESLSILASRLVFQVPVAYVHRKFEPDNILHSCSTCSDKSSDRVVP